MNTELMEKQQIWGLRDTERAMTERVAPRGVAILAYIPDYESEEG